jgi:hypothetical protein
MKSKAEVQGAIDHCRKSEVKYRKEALERIQRYKTPEAAIESLFKVYALRIAQQTLKGMLR